jgi:hypothetical protein
MQEGDALRDRRDWKAALERYQAADAIMHVTTTGLAVARAEVELGMLVEAHDALSDVMRIPARPNEAAALAEARVAAQALFDDLEGRIPSLHVVLAGQTNAAVTIDGAKIPPAALIAHRRVNPGNHVVVARTGSAEKREDVTLAEGEKREVTLDLGATATGPTAAIASVPASSEATTPSAGPWKALTFVGFGVGAAGIAVGAVTGIISISKANAAKAVPASLGGCVDDQCGPATHSDINTSEALGNASTVAFVVGGAGVVLGVTSVFLARSHAHAAPRPSDAATAVKVFPWVGPLSGGVSASF